MVLKRRYDGAGLLRTLSDGVWTMQYDYDAFQRVIRVLRREPGIDAPFRSIAYEYDGSGNRTRMAVGPTSPFSLDYFYNDQNQIDLITENENLVADCVYDLEGRLQHILYGNGVKKEVRRDTKGRLTAIRASVQNNVIFDIEQHYDGADRKPVPVLSAPPICA